MLAVHTISVCLTRESAFLRARPLRVRGLCCPRACGCAASFHVGRCTRRQESADCALGLSAAGSAGVCPTNLSELLRCGSSCALFSRSSAPSKQPLDCAGHSRSLSEACPAALCLVMQASPFAGSAQAPPAVTKFLELSAAQRMQPEALQQLTAILQSKHAPLHRLT